MFASRQPSPVLNKLTFPKVERVPILGEVVEAVESTVTALDKAKFDEPPFDELKVALTEAMKKYVAAEIAWLEKWTEQGDARWVKRKSQKAST